MLILGIHDGHNASAALLQDGTVVAAAQEERFTRVKNQGGMPDRAIQDVLSQSNVTMNDVDVFAIADRYPYHLDWDRDSVLSLFGAGGHSAARIWAGRLKPVRGFRSMQLATARQRRLAARLPADRTEIVEHHECHAAAAYYGQGVLDEPVLVLTADGVGDFLCASVNIGENGRLRRIASVPDLYSLGILYAKITYLMGMVPLEHEHKLMGLAPYGAKSPEHVAQIKEKFAALFRFHPDGMTWTMPDRTRTTASTLGFLKDLVYRERFDWLAAGLQLFLEDMLVEWVDNCVRATGVRAVALGGGVFMNVKANKRILESPEVTSLFVMPSCGDETNSIGAAYAASASAQSRHGQPVAIPPLGHLYLGSAITNDEARRALESHGAKNFIAWQHFSDPEEQLARVLAEGHVAARAAGRMEFGARSLGNRSILADPSKPDIAKLINDIIKDRDFWMPFAPSVIAERSGEYYEKPKPVAAPYMTLTFDSVPNKRSYLRAASHPTDFTLRPQEVVEDWNPGYYSLLQHVSGLTGEAAILNTSFNLHGHPIVRNAVDALHVFQNSGLEYMQLADFIVGKQERAKLGDDEMVLLGHSSPNR